MKNDLKTRLSCGNAVIQLLDFRRAQTGDPELGAAIEKQILDHELADLEKCSLSGNTAKPRRTVITISPLVLAYLSRSLKQATR